MKQLSDEWFRSRIGRITGSRAGAILGCNPWSTADDVLREMVREYHGAEREFTGNVATEYGKANESTAIQAYELERNTKVEECGLFTHGDCLGASPDGLLPEGGVLEIKTPYGLRNGGVFKSLDDQPHYYAQVQLEMYCSMRRWAHFVQWNPKNGLHITPVEIDGEWLDYYLPLLEDFHKRYLSELDNPEHLEPKRKEITSMQAHKLAEEYADLKDAQDRAKERQKDILEELTLYSGGKDASIGDFKLTKVCRKGSVSYAKVVKKYCTDVDLTEYTGQPTEYWTLK